MTEYKIVQISFHFDYTNFSFQAWSDKFPTDSEIIMSCFAAYFDNCMPPNYSSSDGKPFTNVYFVKAADKSDSKAATAAAQTSSDRVTPATTASRERCIITQTTAKPPYFFLQMPDDKFDVSPGETSDQNLAWLLDASETFLVEK